MVSYQKQVFSIINIFRTVKRDDIQLFVTDKEKATLLQLNYETSEYRVIPVLGHMGPTDITFDPVFQKVIWIDKKKHLVRRVSRFGDDEVTLLHSNLLNTGELECHCVI